MNLKNQRVLFYVISFVAKSTKTKEKGNSILTVKVINNHKTTQTKLQMK